MRTIAVFRKRFTTDVGESRWPVWSFDGLDTTVELDFVNVSTCIIYAPDTLLVT